ncbi:hypothetical protein BDZ85DRAFT_45507 [Elsinoe ampelina]|uniref:Uncharacterized protein n=1 Tax=Elsinoe ampelina TaxID=302913 RepID=A0A6A6G1D5_9PEZI|nr:hypothetical protein BDZ85DRAFT_45507 [Elsinoe ampelina]
MQDMISKVLRRLTIIFPHGPLRKECLFNTAKLPTSPSPAIFPPHQLSPAGPISSSQNSPRSSGLQDHLDPPAQCSASWPRNQRHLSHSRRTLTPIPHAPALLPTIYPLYLPHTRGVIQPPPRCRPKRSPNDRDASLPPPDRLPESLQTKVQSTSALRAS